MIMMTASQTFLFPTTFAWLGRLRKDFQCPVSIRREKFVSLLKYRTVSHTQMCNLPCRVPTANGALQVKNLGCTPYFSARRSRCCRKAKNLHAWADSRTSFSGISLMAFLSTIPSFCMSLSVVCRQRGH